MEEKTYFLNMFSDYEPPESLKNAISQAAIVAADLYPVVRRISMVIRCERYIPQRMLDIVSADICEIYGLRDLDLQATYPADQLNQMLHEDILELFVAENSTTRGSLAGAKWEWNDNTLTISLVANGKKELEKCIPAVQNAISQQFGVSVSIVIEAGKALEGNDLFEAMEKIRSNMIAELPMPKESEEYRLQFASGADFKALGTTVLADLTAYAKEKGLALATPNFEGVRLCFTGNVEGWALVRMSLHEPLMPINVESNHVGGTANIKEFLREFFARYDFYDNLNVLQ